MASVVRDIVMHPGDIYPLLKMKMVIWNVEKEISSPAQPRPQHWAFCYPMLYRVSRSFALVIYQLQSDQLRDAVLVFYLLLRALDTVEDDMDIPADIKIPILRSFHRHIYDINWKFSCGTAHYKDLMDQFHHVQSAFLELNKSYQEIIEEVVKLMGEGMAKFVINEIETINDLDEYAYYVAGLVGLGLSKLFHASGLEDMAPENLSYTLGVFLHKEHIIKDFLEDINEVPKVRMFWPRQIWSKYVDSLEDLKHEDNSMKALQCLNEMITNALMHAEDCLKCLSYLRDTSIFRSCAIPLVMTIGTLASCYNNIETFRSGVKLRRGLAAKIFDQTRQMSDVYDAFIEYSSILQSKVEMDDPNATETLSRIQAIQKYCRNPCLKQ